MFEESEKIYFINREDAGQQLAELLQHYRGQPDVLLLALPRGGVPVGYEIARAIGAPLDVLVIRKLGVPSQPELAMGALANGGITVFNDDVLKEYRITRAEIDGVIEREQLELNRRLEKYRRGLPDWPLEGKMVVLVDDGLATGATMRAAIKVARSRNPKCIAVAVPAAAPSTAEAFEREVDKFYVLARPVPFFSVGGNYEEFPQVSDEEVTELLRRAVEFQ